MSLDGFSGMTLIVDLYNNILEQRRGKRKKTKSSVFSGSICCL